MAINPRERQCCEECIILIERPPLPRTTPSMKSYYFFLLNWPPILRPEYTLRLALIPLFFQFKLQANPEHHGSENVRMSKERNRKA